MCEATGVAASVVWLFFFIPSSLRYAIFEYSRIDDRLENKKCRSVLSCVPRLTTLVWAVLKWLNVYDFMYVSVLIFPKLCSAQCN